MRIAHLVNPYASDTQALAQRVTFETMRIARDFAAGTVDVELLSAQLPEDAPSVPQFLTRTPALERSVLDVGTFAVPRKLPLLRDLVARLHAGSDADVLVYTNADIALMPFFYVLVARLLERYDAFVINRRSIAEYSSLDDLPLMLAETGEPHPGWDCFVFPRALVPDLVLGDVCLGARYAGRTLLTNLICLAPRFAELRGLHATFHLGTEEPWRDPRFDDYAEHNRTQLAAVLRELDARGVLVEHPLVLRLDRPQRQPGSRFSR